MRFQFPLERVLSNKLHARQTVPYNGSIKREITIWFVDVGTLVIWINPVDVR